MYSIPHIIVNPKPKSANSTEKWEYGVELRCIMLGIWLKIGTVKVATELQNENCCSAALLRMLLSEILGT